MLVALLARQQIAGRVLEPCAGHGQLVRPLRDAGLEVITNDIATGSVDWICKWCGIKNHTSCLDNLNLEYKLTPCRECEMADPLRKELIRATSYKCDYHMDATQRKFWVDIPDADWVVTNPPFSQLDDILEWSLATAKIGVAMILRLSALEPACKRARRGNILEAYADNLRYVMPFSGPRPSFTRDGKTDSVTTAWFVWNHGWSWRSHGMKSPFQFVTDWKKAV